MKFIHRLLAHYYHRRAERAKRDLTAAIILEEARIKADRAHCAWHAERSHPAILPPAPPFGTAGLLQPAGRL